MWIKLYIGTSYIEILQKKYAANCSSLENKIDSVLRWPHDDRQASKEIIK